MVNGLYTFKEYVNNDGTDEGRRFSDPEFVKTLLTGVASKADLINAIETYNENHKLNEKERIKYSVGIAGELYVTVIHAYKLGGDGSTTYAIVGRDHNGYGILNKGADSSKSNTFDSAISTHVVDISDITDVWIGGYDKDEMEDIMNFNGEDEIPAKELENLLTTLRTELNSIQGSGEYRTFFNKFTYVMKKNNLNSLKYTHRPTAYNIYTSIWTKYIALINDILANYAEKGFETIDWDKVRMINSLFFVDTSEVTLEEGEGDTDLDKIKKILKAEFAKKYTAEVGTSWYENNIDEFVEKALQRTFSQEDIDKFKAVISKD